MLTEEKNLCMGCMSVLDENGKCRCGFDEDAPTDEICIPVRTVIGGKYLVGRMIKMNGEAITYIGFDKENEEYKNKAVENADIRIKYTPVIEALCGLLPVILILFGGYLVIKGEMTIGQLVTFNGLMWAFTQPINMFGHLVDNVQRFSASADRLYELYCTKPSIKNCENPICKDDERAPKVKGEIEFRNVSFAYNETPVLKNVSFKIKPGMTVGILGPTGSGKSTIAKLMCRYYDTVEGSVLLDGVDVKNYDLQYLRQNIGITMQEVFLFSDTVEGNIAFGVPEASFEDVEAAKKSVIGYVFDKHTKNNDYKK